MQEGNGPVFQAPRRTGCHLRRLSGSNGRCQWSRSLQSTTLVSSHSTAQHGIHCSSLHIVARLSLTGTVYAVLVFDFSLEWPPSFVASVSAASFICTSSLVLKCAYRQKHQPSWHSGCTFSTTLGLHQDVSVIHTTSHHLCISINISFCSSATLCCKHKGHEVHQSVSVFRYHQAGTPKLEVSTSYDSSEHTYTIRTKQSTPTPAGQPAKLPVMLPLAVALFDKSGHELPLKLKVCMLAMLLS